MDFDRTSVDFVQNKGKFLPEQTHFFTEQMWIFNKTNVDFLQNERVFFAEQMLGFTEQMWTVYTTNVDRLQNKCPISLHNSQNTCVFYRTNVGFAS